MAPAQCPPVCLQKTASEIIPSRRLAWGIIVGRRTDREGLESPRFPLQGFTTLKVGQGLSLFCSSTYGRVRKERFGMPSRGRPFKC